MGILDRFRGPRVQRVAPPRAHEIVEAGAQFIDVRNRREYKAGHPAGARNIALHTLPKQIHNLDADRPVVCICHTGVRSGRAGRLLLKEGFGAVYNVAGGSLAWHGHRLPWKA